VTEAVVREIRGRLRMASMGERPLRGVGGPVGLYRVLSAERRAPAEAAVLDTPFVGRAAELRTMLEAWDTVRSGGSRVIIVTGEAGIGKSRMIREFRARMTRGPHLWLMAAGSDIFRGTPFYPVVHLLNRLIGTQRGDLAHRQRRLVHLLQMAGLEPAE